MCVEGEDSHGECSSSVRPCSAGQTAYAAVTGEEQCFKEAPGMLPQRHLATNAAQRGEATKIARTDTRATKEFTNKLKCFRD